MMGHPPPHFLSRARRAGYGAADLGLSAALLMVQLYLFEFYTREIGLSPLLVGLAVALGIGWDAISDPLMGRLLDRTRTRWGRFLPYLVSGGLALPVTFVLLFNPPDFGVAGAFCYLLGTFLLFNTATTLLGVPHLALGGSLSTDPDERTELYGWRLIFGTVGLLLGVTAPLLASGTDLLSGAAQTDAGSRGGGSLLVAGVGLLFTALSIAAVWSRCRGGRDEASGPSLRQVRQGWRRVLQNPVFRPLLLSFFLVSLGRAMNGMLALPYYKFSLQLPEAAVQQWVLGLFAICIAGSVVGWLALSRRYGKKWPGFAGMVVLGVLTVVAYPLFPPGVLTGPLVAAVVGGFAVGAIILFESMLADVAEADQVASGESAAGLFFGFWRLGQKLATSAGVLLMSFILEWIGYQEGTDRQSPAVQRGLAWLFGPGVGVFFLAGAFIFARTPLPAATVPVRST